MRYSCATVSLPTLTPAEAVDELAAAGYQGVEWKVGDARRAMGSAGNAFLVDNRCTVHPGQTDLADLAARCAGAGLEIVGIGPYVDIGDRAGLATAFDVAAALGAPQLRLQAARTGRPEGQPFHLATEVERTKEFLAHAEQLAATRGVRVVLEMHHRTIAPSAALARSLVEHTDPTLVGVIYDVGNTVWEGSEDPRLALQLLGPYLHHVHLKNAAARRAPDGRWNYVWSPLDDGLVPVADVLGLLREHGYSGWISLEDLSTERTPSQTLRHNATVLKGLPAAQWSRR